MSAAGSRSQGGQGGSWHVLRHTCAPHDSTRPHAPPHDHDDSTRHGTSRVFASGQWHTCVTDSVQSSQGPSWHSFMHLCTPHCSMRWQGRPHTCGSLLLHITDRVSAPQPHSFVMVAWHGGQGPGWHNNVHGCGQARGRRHCFPHVWATHTPRWYSGDRIAPHMHRHAVGIVSLEFWQAGQRHLPSTKLLIAHFLMHLRWSTW